MTEDEFSAIFDAELRKALPVVTAMVKKWGPARTIAYAFASSNAQALAGKLKREALEAKLSLEKSYKGIWRAADDYSSGQLVTHDGSLWLCKQPCCGVRPGTSAKWTMIVKRGRDGKDAAR